MNCMKCGKETEANQIFCPGCLAVMEKNPVKPGAVVQIPAQPARKQPHHRRAVLAPEDQIKRLIRQVRVLMLLVILTSTIAVFFALMAFDILERANMRQLLGQNYSVVVATEAPTEPEETVEVLATEPQP